LRSGTDFGLAREVSVRTAGRALYDRRPVGAAEIAAIAAALLVT
jgi:hypothetical protein